MPSKRPPGRRHTTRPPHKVPVVLQTRVTKGTRDKLDHYIAWINDPETWRFKRNKAMNQRRFSISQLEELPRSISAVVEEALSRYLTDLLTERVDGQPNMQERSFIRQHPEAIDPEDPRPLVRAAGRAKVLANPKPPPPPPPPANTALS